MDKKYQKIQKLAVEILQKVIRKDYILHTLTVTQAMEMLLDKEGGNPDILIPAALCHDLGWSNVPKKFQVPILSKEDKLKALKMHVDYNPPLTGEILTKCDYSQNKINKIIQIIKAHKFIKPDSFEEKMLIDADTLSDVFKDQFYSDAKSYKRTPKDLLEFRSTNTYFTKTAREIFKKEFTEREKEIYSKYV